MLSDGFENPGTGKYPKHALKFFPDFIWIYFLDVINGVTSVKVIELMIDLSAAHGIKKFIVDSRGCPINFPVSERYEVGKYWAERTTHDLYSASIVDKENWSGLVETVATNRGGSNVLIATDEAKALEWIKAIPLSEFPE